MIDPRLNQKLVDLFSYRYRWQSFREIQNRTIPPVLDGKNLLLIAGTASGKTEAVMIPVVNQLLELSVGLKCIYFAPLKSLINDVASRLELILRPFGLVVGKWHGDLTKSEKFSTAQEASILVTTPESVEGIFLSENVDLLSKMEFVIIDEVHAFIDSPRGAQLASIMERIKILSGIDQQRIAMSATVGNPELLLEWLNGSSNRESEIVIDDIKNKKAIEILTEGEISPAEYLARLLEETDDKILLFSYSRAKAEDFAASAKTLGLDTPVHHSSVSRSLREEIEEDFKRDKRLRAIVATSTLEMGIDIGDIDRVIFLEIPPSTASFLQRAGRAGRKKNKSTISVFVEDPQSLYNLLGILDMLEEGTVEPLKPSSFHLPLLGHQLIGLTKTAGSLCKEDLAVLKGAFPFRQIGSEDFEIIVDHLVEESFLARRGNTLASGAATAEMVGSGKEKMDFVVLFPGGFDYSVIFNGHEIGKIHPAVLSSSTDDEVCFLLGGRSFLVKEVSSATKTVHVVLGDSGKPPSWFGGSSLMTKEFARAIRSSLKEMKIPNGVVLSHDASQMLLDFIDNHRASSISISLRNSKRSVIIETFAGDMSNIFLSLCIKAVSGIKKISSSWHSVIVRDGIDIDELQEMLLAISRMEENEINGLLSTYLRETPSELKKHYELLGEKLDRFVPQQLLVKYVMHRFFDSHLLRELSEAVMVTDAVS
ncbi:MAG: DEAD/DEAH box helicase [Kosmotogaceae bacterium]|nr:DEAD/DEAH box helicase [Kosmotogaceae bacterium]